MTDKIAVIDGASFIKENFLEIKKIIETEKCKLVPLSEGALLFLQSKGIPCINYCDFENKETYADVYAIARKWGMSWYKPNGKDYSEIDSFSLGNSIEWYMIYFFSHLLRLHISLSLITDNLRPKEILLIMPDAKNLNEGINMEMLECADSGTITRLVDNCMKNRLPQSNLRLTQINTSAKVSKNENKVNLVKIFGDCINKAFKITGIINRRKKILFFEGFNHLYDIMGSPELAKYSKIHLQKSISPSLFPKLYKAKIMPIGLEYKRIGGSAMFEMSGIKDALSKFFLYHKEDLFTCIWPRLEAIIKNYFPKIAGDMNSVKDVLSKEKPVLVVAENDTTYYEKILITLSKQMNIHTAVIQHGLSPSPDAYKNNQLVVHHFYPLSADSFFCFGEFFKKWFLNMGIPPEKIIVTGGARFDNYYKNKIKFDNQKKENKTVLVLFQDVWAEEGVITHHIRLSVFAKHLKKIIELAKANPEINFIVRPHSGDNLWNEIFSDELSALSNLVVSRKESLNKLFTITDLVIGYYSTALVEMLINDVPVISLDTGEYYSFLPLWEYGLSRRVSSIDNLGQEIKEMIEQKERDFLRENINKNMRLFNYDNDGLASGRIAAVIDRTIANLNSSQSNRTSWWTEIFSAREGALN